MKTRYVALFVLLAVAAFSVARSDEKAPAPRADTAVVVPTLEEAHRQAEILHTAMHATLQIVHHRYYQEDEGLLLPAATLKEVFAEVEKEQGIKLRWLAVEGQVMNTDHTARDEFEREAVKALKAGKPAYESTEQGVYRRAGPITLTNHCLKCHVPDRKSTEDRTAGLIISMPVK
jgi:hypothetical protein